MSTEVSTSAYKSIAFELLVAILRISQLWQSAKQKYSLKLVINNEFQGNQLAENRIKLTQASWHDCALYYVQIHNLFQPINITSCTLLGIEFSDSSPFCMGRVQTFNVKRSMVEHRSSINSSQSTWSKECFTGWRKPKTSYQGLIWQDQFFLYNVFLTTISMSFLKMTWCV